MNRGEQPTLSSTFSDLLKPVFFKKKVIRKHAIFCNQKFWKFSSSAINNNFSTPNTKTLPNFLPKTNWNLLVGGDFLLIQG